MLDCGSSAVVLPSSLLALGYHADLTRKRLLTHLSSFPEPPLRLNCIRHFLWSLTYPNKDERVVRGPDPLIVGESGYAIGRSAHPLPHGPRPAEYEDLGT